MINMNTKEMMVLDTNTEAMGISKSVLMENAGRCLAQKIFDLTSPCKIAIFAGTGGNGGDGLVAARYLLNQDFDVEIFFLGHPSQIKSVETRMQMKVLQNITSINDSIKIHTITDSSQLHDIDAAVVVDAILGTGAKGLLREPVSSAIEVINHSDAVKIAVDIPSGVDPVTGVVSDRSVKANFTVTFHRQKIGLKNAETEFVGKVHVCDIGIPKEAEVLTGPGDLLRMINRNENSHKGQNGKVLVVGGSKDYSGAPALAAMSALRSGADLSVVACSSSVVNPIRSYSPDIIVKGLSKNYIQPNDSSKILKLSENADVVVVGCGIGMNEETGLVLNEMIEKIKIPLVIDADALKLIDHNSINNVGKKIVLTPHKAEFKAFFGITVPEDLDNKIKVVKVAAKRSGCVVLLKGVVDIISDGETVRLNSTGNPGMTVGGTGDVLAGVVGGLIAQGHDIFESAYLGAFINGTAGDLAKADHGYGFLASDILKYIPQAIWG